MDKLFKGIKLINGTSKDFTLDNLTDKSVLYFIRTSNNKDEGYLYFNGKKYGNNSIESIDMDFTDGLSKTITDDKIVVSIDEDYIGSVVARDTFLKTLKDDASFKGLMDSYIASYLKDNGYIEDIVYNVLENTLSYELTNSNYNWYDFSNANKGIIRFTESAVTPTGDTPNFSDKYIPSYKMNLLTPLNLEETPYFYMEAITLNDSPFQFKLIDSNGNSTIPIAFGNIDKTKEIAIDTSTHQELKPTNMHISSLHRGTYTNADKTSSGATTTAAINAMIEKLSTEFTTNGEYDTTYFAKPKIMVEEIPGIEFEEGFDKTNITTIEIQMVEWCDKDTITWKARDKAFIINKFLFTEK